MQQENLGQSVSLWMATTAVPNQSTLGEDTHADVCIVGAGIAGITTAYLLAKQGKSVVVLDDGAIGGGQTQRTTAHLSNALDDRYFEIERLHGSEGAKLAAGSHTAAIDRIESIVGEEQIACDFVRLDGYLFLPPGESPELLDRELAAAHRAGLGGVERLPRAPLPSFDTGPCLRFPRQAQFHPLKYLTAVAGAIERAGGRIFTGTHAETIKGGKPARIKTSSGRIVTADAVVVATNSPVNDLLAIHTKQAAYMSYAIGAIVPRGAVATALYWDTLDPYHYVRIQPLSPEAGMTEQSGAEGQDVLIVGGEDHKTGQAQAHSDPYARLEAWTRSAVPDDPGSQVPLVGPGDGDHRRAGFHRAESAGRAERLHRDRRLGNGDDPWHHRGHPPDRPDPRSGEPLGHALRPFPKDPACPGPVCERESQRRQAIRRLADRRGCGFAGADQARRGRGHPARPDEDSRLSR